MPEYLERDIELMQKAHVNCVSLGVFAWSNLEPEEGVYTFDWMTKVIDNLYAAGIDTILATPSGARPAWMAQKYPEVLRVSNTLKRNTFGGRHNHCYSSPVFREKVRQIDSRLAKRYGGHPGAILWHISNEYGGECFCPLCRVNFRELKRRPAPTCLHPCRLLRTAPIRWSISSGGKAEAPARNFTAR